VYLYSIQALETAVVLQSRKFGLSNSNVALICATEGGAVRAINSNVTIEDCLFENNRGTLYGGAVLMESSNVAIWESLFIGNEAVGSSDINIDGNRSLRAGA
jgi:predicted outer membrane repeat protein